MLHYRLLAKLSELQINPHVLEGIPDFLESRLHYTTANNSKSTFSPESIIEVHLDRCFSLMYTNANLWFVPYFTAFDFLPTIVYFIISFLVITIM